MISIREKKYVKISMGAGASAALFAVGTVSMIEPIAVSTLFAMGVIIIICVVAHCVLSPEEEEE